MNELIGWVIACFVTIFLVILGIYELDSKLREDVKTQKEVFTQNCINKGGRILREGDQFISESGDKYHSKLIALCVKPDGEIID